MTVLLGCIRTCTRFSAVVLGLYSIVSCFGTGPGSRGLLVIRIACTMQRMHYLSPWSPDAHSTDVCRFVYEASQAWCAHACNQQGCSFGSGRISRVVFILGTESSPATRQVGIPSGDTGCGVMCWLDACTSNLHIYSGLVGGLPFMARVPIQRDAVVGYLHRQSVCGSCSVVGLSWWAGVCCVCLLWFPALAPACLCIPNHRVSL